MDDDSLSDGDDDVFKMNAKTVKTQHQPDEIAESVNNSYDFMINGNSTNSFPSMAADFLFTPAPVDVCPRNLPSMTRKSRENARKMPDRDDNSSVSTNFDPLKVGSKNRHSLRKRRNLDVMEENELRMKTLSMGHSSPLKTVKKWKSLRHKDK